MWKMVMDLYRPDFYFPVKNPSFFSPSLISGCTQTLSQLYPYKKLFILARVSIRDSCTHIRLVPVSNIGTLPFLVHMCILDFHCPKAHKDQTNMWQISTNALQNNLVSSSTNICEIPIFFVKPLLTLNPFTPTLHGPRQYGTNCFHD